MLYTTFKEMKDSKKNRPFDKKKYLKYIESLKEFQKMKIKLVKDNKEKMK